MTARIYPSAYSTSTASYNIDNSNYAILNQDILNKYQDQIFDSEECAVFRLTYENPDIGTKAETYVVSKEFTAPENVIYVPFEKIEDIFAETGSEITIEYIDPPQATHIKLKPMSKELYDIKDIKTFLENIIIKDYPILVEDSVIKFGYQDTIVCIRVESLLPNNVCRAHNTDLNVEFVEPDKGILPETKDNIRSSTKNDINDSPIDCDSEDEELTEEELRLKRIAYFEKRT